jgi:SAM-dependent methyltransferase
MGDDRSRRVLFDAVAEDYDAVRPGYPEELVDDVVALSEIPEGGRILEVGCGTGQATLAFARRGYAMVCLDIGAELATMTAHKCRPFPQVEVQVAAFEDWRPGPRPFDLVISATAFHWIAREIAYPKAAQALGPNGSLAVFYNAHPLPFTGVFAAVQEIYQILVPEWPPIEEDSLDQRIATQEAYINGTALFERVTVRRYGWSEWHTREQHIRLLNTYSSHRSLEESRRESLFTAIGDLIDRDFGGMVERPYLSVLFLAKKCT